MANYYNKDLYKTLGLTFEASQAEIKSAFRKLARKYHPDVTNTDDTVEKFKEIKEAYDILSDEEARKKYDVLHGYYQDRLRREYEEKQRQKSQEYSEYIARARQRAQKEKKNETFTNAVNDALDNLFNIKKSSQEEKTTPVNGEDINLDITISCFEAANGTNRTVNILHTQACPNCGSRMFINGAKCQMCNGTGTVSLQKKINVKIPKGVSQGSKVRVKREGNKGINGGKDGDLYLVVNIEKSRYFEIDELNVLCNLPITPFEAALGAEITIPALDGNVNVKIPPLTSSGQKLRLSGQGLENKNRTKKGDMIITVNIKFPEKLSAKETELYEKLKRFSSADIRKDMSNEK